MTIEYIRYTIPEGQQAAFLDDYHAAKEPLLRSPYALNFELTQCTEDSTQFIVRIEWTSAEDHLSKFRGSPEFRDFFTHIRPYLENIDEMRHYESRL